MMKKTDIKTEEIQTGEGLTTRREALKKVGIYSLTTATMMMLVRTPARAQTSSEPAVPPPGDGDPWVPTV